MKNEINRRKTRSSILIETNSGNKYLFDRRLKKSIICHPILFHLCRLKAEGDDPIVWVERQNGKKKEEAQYYYRKMQLLEQNGFFGEIDQDRTISSILTAEAIKISLANLRQLTFEITDDCNLECQYCGYGKFYKDYDQRENKKLDIETAKNLILYLKKYMDSPLNVSKGYNTYISFYGGEPLLNFQFIHEMVSFINSLNWKYNRITFSMTTNALLLEKHMDFLMENDFSLLISLDGNEANNAYRLQKNGKPSYQRIIKNVECLRGKYPDYFKQKVNFNAVLHNKNSVTDIFNFFKEQYNKQPSIGSLNTSGIREEEADNFWETYSNYSESLYNSEDYSRIQKEMFIKLADVQMISTFIHNHNDFCFRDYSQLIHSSPDTPRLPTGTCSPFSQKMFVTVNGKILACERIGHQFQLGRIDKNIELDFDQIAENYNQWFERVRVQCRSCDLIDQCSQCIFYLDLSGNQPVCKNSLNGSQFSRHLSSILGYLEHNPTLYNKILKEVIIE